MVFTASCFVTHNIPTPPTCLCPKAHKSSFLKVVHTSACFALKMIFFFLFWKKVESCRYPRLTRHHDQSCHVIPFPRHEHHNDAGREQHMLSCMKNNGRPDQGKPQVTLDASHNHHQWHCKASASTGKRGATSSKSVKEGKAVRRMAVHLSGTNTANNPVAMDT